LTNHGPFPVFATALSKKNELPEKSALLVPRKDAETFAIFCNAFLSCTVGKVTYKERVMEERISSFVTISDEAYTLLYLENCYDRWLAEANGSEKQTHPEKKWTSAPQSATLYKGWDEAGIHRYNDLVSSITDQRKEEETKTFEDNIRTGKEEDHMQKYKKKKVPKKGTDYVEPLVPESEPEDEVEDDKACDSDAD
jgi:hypothetical protein